MFINDLINVLLINKRIPNLLRIDHHYWALIATIKTARLINPHATSSSEPKTFNLRLSVVTQSLRAMVVARAPTIGALITTKKYVMLIKAHKR